MQISALNLIMAAQQARQDAAHRSLPGSVEIKPANNLATPDEFVPLAFKPGETAPEEPTAPQPSSRPTARPGSQLDIRV